MKQAIADYEAAQRLIPDNGFVQSNGLFVYLCGIELAKSQGEDFADWQAKADGIRRAWPNSEQALHPGLDGISDWPHWIPRIPKVEIHSKRNDDRN